MLFFFWYRANILVAIHAYNFSKSISLVVTLVAFLSAGTVLSQDNTYFQSIAYTSVLRVVMFLKKKKIVFISLFKGSCDHSSDFLCTTTELCIDKHLVCDNIPNCLDQSDEEQDCTCKWNQYCLQN